MRRHRNNNNNNNSNNNIVPRVIRKKLNLSNVEDESILKDAIQKKVDNSIKIYDYNENDEVSVNPFSLDSSNIIFKSSNSYFQYPKNIIQEHLNSRENLIYECKEKLYGAPRTEDLHYDKPYYLLRGHGNFVIKLQEIYDALNKSNYKVFNLEKTDKHLSHTASYDSILQDNSNRGLRGQEVNIMSADHCQGKSERDVYELIPISFKPKNGGVRNRTKKSSRKRK